LFVGDGSDGGGGEKSIRRDKEDERTK